MARTLKAYTDATITIEGSTDTDSSDGAERRSDRISVHLPDGRTVAIDLLQVQGSGLGTFGTIWVHAAGTYEIVEYVNL